MSSVNPAPTNASQQSSYVYPIGILLATFSLITLLLIIPPMCWHYRNRNIGATALVAWLIILLLFNFINAIIWPTDDWSRWYNGVGLCDVEVKFQVAGSVALPASFACILRGLAAVVDTEKTTLIKTRAEKLRNYAIDLSWCLGFPLLEMLFHFIVQHGRYYIWGISGCTASFGLTWLTVLLVLVPPAIWVVVNVYYAVLIIIRLYHYRLNFRSILASSNTPRSRFIRLYLICWFWILCSVPLEAYIMYRNSFWHWGPFNWSEGHNAEALGAIVYVNSDGRVLYDRWLPLAFGILVFLFFGFGRDAISMYKSCLTAVGLGACFGRLVGREQRSSSASTINSFSSRAKMLLKWKTASFSTWSGTSSRSPTSSSTDPLSPKDARLHTTLGQAMRTSRSADVEKGIRTQQSPSMLSRMLSAVHIKRSSASHEGQTMQLDERTQEKGSVQSSVCVGLPVMDGLDKGGECYHVVVSKEVRRGSEAA